jgi:hypothetical protein
MQRGEASRVDRFVIAKLSGKVALNPFRVAAVLAHWASVVGFDRLRFSGRSVAAHPQQHIGAGYIPWRGNGECKAQKPSDA